MKKNQYSFKKLIFLYFIILLITTVCGMFVIGGYSVWSSRQQLEEVNNSVLNVYISKLEADMADLTTLNQDIFVNNYAFQSLAAGRYDANQKLLYEYELRNTIKNTAPPYGAVLIFDDADEISICRYGSDYDYSDTLRNMELKEQIKAYWRSETGENLFSWHIYTKDKRIILLNTYKQHNLYICSLIDLERFVSLSHVVEEHALMQVAFYDDETIYFTQDPPVNISLADIKEENRNLFPLQHYMTQSARLENADLNICCIMPLEYLWDFSRVSVFLILIISAMLTLLILVIYFSIRKIMVYPLDQIASASERLQMQELPLQSENISSITELQKINDALEKLVEQKVSLEKENLTKQQEKEQAWLQYFQLQTRPHFFVNCLKSLYNMLENQEYGRMQRMILAFSNHLRYIFHDNLSLVPLKAELEEVSDYYNIILMDRCKPIILTQNVQDELLQQPVPPLLVQTFLENSVKYNGKNEKALRFLIQVDTVCLEDRPYMRIRLSDNGIGYSKDILEKLNCPDSELYEKYHVGISNLKKRLQLIYQTDYQCTFYNEPSGGACALICLPLEEKSLRSPFKKE